MTVAEAEACGIKRNRPPASLPSRAEIREIEAPLLSQIAEKKLNIKRTSHNALDLVEWEIQQDEQRRRAARRR
jgi:hypothetical protein